MSMANIFGSGLVKVFDPSWKVKEVRNFNEEEQAAIERAEVRPSEYGTSVCFHMKGGGMAFIPTSNNTEAAVGQVVDMEKSELMTLERDGKEIVRVVVR